MEGAERPSAIHTGNFYKTDVLAPCRQRSAERDRYVGDAPCHSHRSTSQLGGFVHDDIGTELVEDRPQINLHHGCGTFCEKPGEVDSPAPPTW